MDFFNFCWVFQKFPFFFVTLYLWCTDPWRLKKMLWNYSIYFLILPVACTCCTVLIQPALPTHLEVGRQADVGRGGVSSGGQPLSPWHIRWGFYFYWAPAEFDWTLLYGLYIPRSLSVLTLFIPFYLPSFLSNSVSPPVGQIKLSTKSW